MKKLLSLLSVLTISGTAVPTTIAASPYQKQKVIRIKREIKKNINFLKTFKVSDNNEFLNKPIIYNEDIIYFVTYSKVIEYNLKNMTSSVVLESDKENLKFGIILNNKLYVFSYGGSIFEYNIKDKISNNVYNINDNNSVNPRISYGVKLNESVYFVTDFGGFTKDKIYKYTPVNNHLEVIFNDFDIKNLYFSVSDGLEKIFFIHNNKYYKYFGTGEPIKTNILYLENYSKHKDKVNLYNKEYYFSDDNFQLYKKNDLNIIQIYEYEKFYESYKINNNWIFELNGRIYFASQYASKFNEYYSFESILVNEPVFNLLIKNFTNWIKELNNININLLSKNDVSNKIQIFLQYLCEFNQNFEILRNKENIRELSSKISVIENNILELKNEISNIINKINEISASLPNKKLETCSTAKNVISSSTKWIPEIGTYISTVASIISSMCKHFS